MSKNKMIMLPREVVEQALWVLDNASHPHGKDWAEHGVARKALRSALDRLQAEQEPAPSGATHIQLQQGAFYKRVDGKWYVWSLMKNGEPHRWYISPGTAESCLEPLAAAPQPPALEQVQPDPAPYLWYDPENGDTWTQEAIDEGFCATDGLIPLYTK